MLTLWMTGVVNVNPKLIALKPESQNLLQMWMKTAFYVQYTMVYSWMLPIDLFSFYLNSLFVFVLPRSLQKQKCRKVVDRLVFVFPDMAFYGNMLIWKSIAIILLNVKKIAFKAIMPWALCSRPVLPSSVSQRSSQLLRATTGLSLHDM